MFVKVFTNCVFLSGVLLATAIGPANAETTITEHVNRTVRADSVSQIDVSLRNGSITLHATDANVVSINATISGRSTEAVHACSIVSSSDGRTLRLGSSGPTVRRGLWTSPGCRVDFVIDYPARFAVNVDTTNGNVLSNGPAGSLSAHSANGSIEVDNPHASVAAKSENGNITIAVGAYFAGRSIDADTSLGNILLLVPTEFTGYLKASSGLGNVNAISLPGGSTTVRLSTGMGNVVVRRSMKQ